MRDILRLGSYLAPYKGRVLLAILASMLASLCLGGFWLLARPIAEEVFKQRETVHAPQASAPDDAIGSAASAPPAFAGGAAAPGNLGGGAESWRAWARRLQARVETALGILQLREYLAAS